MSRVSFKIPGVNPDHANFYQVVNDDAAMFMTDLVHGHKEIHLYMDHPIDEPVEAEVEDTEPLEVLQLGVEISVEPLKADVGYDQALQVLDPEVVEVDDPMDYNDRASYYEDEVDSDGYDSEHYYDHATYEDDDHYNYDFHDNDMSMGKIMRTIDMIVVSLLDMIMIMTMITRVIILR